MPLYDTCNSPLNGDCKSFPSRLFALFTSCNFCFLFATTLLEIQQVVIVCLYGQTGFKWPLTVKESISSWRISVSFRAEQEDYCEEL
jgi:hypothetical protein